MIRKFTFLFAAAISCSIPCISQSAIDSLEGFQAETALIHSGESHDPIEYANQIRIAKRNFIDKKYQLGNYSPEIQAAGLRHSGSNTVQAACSNLNFETGDFTSWTGYIGDNQTSNLGPLDNIAPGIFTAGNDALITNVSARHTIITPAYGNDTYGGFPGVPSGSGNYTVRMGGQTPNYQGEILEQTFTVSPSSTNLGYRYAVVLNDPQTGHGQTDKPYLKVEVLNQFGQPVSTCSQLFLVADATTLSGFTLSSVPPPTGLVYYKSWTDVNVDLSAYVNQNVTIRFTVAGCTQSGHFAYCYLDCSCFSFATSTYFCPSTTSLFLTAPSAYATYQWYDQNHDSIPGATNDSLFISNPVAGDTFFVYLESATDSNCNVIQPVILQYSNISANTSSTNPVCAGYNNGTATANPTMGTAPYTYTWSTSPNQFTQTITGLSPGTYTVHIVDAMGCQNDDSVTIVEPPVFTMALSYVDETNAAANDGAATATPIGGVPGYSYLWTPGNLTTAGVAGLDAGTYICCITDSNGCTVCDSVVIGTMIGINSNEISTFNVNVFPNPANENVQISFSLNEKKDIKLELFNLLGEKMSEVSLGNMKEVNHTYTTSTLPNGIYFFRISAGTTTVTRKITVVH